MNNHFCAQLFTCVLCENLSDLNAPCCCQEKNEDMTEITEPRLLKRGNLQRGDTLCFSHFEKLTSGMIFGGSGGCCAPFHVEKTHGTRLRPLPRMWRNFFDSSVPTNRYLPSLQICSQCYNITLDLMLDTKSNKDEINRKPSDSSSKSSPSAYTSPRRWMSSVSLHMPSGSTSGSTWSLSSSRQFARSSTHLLSLYAAQSERLGRPRAVPESVKRYFKYSKQDQSGQSETTPSLSRLSSFEISNATYVDECENESITGRVSQSSIDRTDSNMSMHSQVSSIESDKSKNENEQDQTTKNKTELTKLILTPQRKLKELSRHRERRVCKLNFSSPVDSTYEEDVFFSASTQQTHLKNPDLKKLPTIVDCTTNKENQKQKVSDQDTKNLNIEAVTKEASNTAASLPAKNNSSRLGSERIFPNPKPIKITTKSVISTSHASQPSCLPNAPETTSTNEVTALISSNSPLKAHKPCFTTKRHSNIKHISIAPKNNACGREVNENTDTNDNTDLSNNKKSLESHQQLQYFNDMLTSWTPESRGSMTQDVIKFVIENHSSLGLSRNDVNRLISLIENVNPGALEVFARALAQSIVSFALEDATVALIKEKKQIKSLPKFSKNQETTSSDACFQNFDDVLGNLKANKKISLIALPEHDDIKTCEKCQTRVIMSGASQKTSQEQLHKVKLLQKLEVTQDKQQAKRQSNVPNSLTVTHTSVKWLTEKHCYRTELNIQVKERNYGDSVLNLKDSARHPDNFSMADDISRDTETSTAEQQQADVFTRHSSHFQVIKCVVEDVVPVTRSFSTGDLDHCDDEGNHFDSHLPVRSSSTESFFTITYQVSEEQDNSEKETTVSAACNVELNKKPESGVFMSMLETDRSCIESVVSGMTDYSDFDDDGTFSSDTENSEIKQSPQITTFNDVSDSECFDTAWQSNLDILSHLSAPIVKHVSVELENLQPNQCLPNSVQKDLLESSDKNSKGLQSDIRPQNDFNALPHVGGEKIPPSEDAYFSEINSQNLSILKQERDQPELLEALKTPNNDELSSDSPSESNEDVAPSLLNGKSAEMFEFSHKTLLPVSEEKQDHQSTAFQSPADEQDEEPSVNEQTRRSAVDWFPSDDVLRQRRSNQFVRAISEVALLSARVRKTKREKLSKTDEDPEEDDVTDIIQRAMQESTPRFLCRKSKAKNDDEANDRSKVVLRAVAILGIVGTLLYVGWRYYNSPSK